MYKWLVTVGMENGQILKCLFENDKSGSMEVAKDIMPEKMPQNYIVCALSEDKKSQICFKAEDISTLEITPLSEENAEVV